MNDDELRTALAWLVDQALDTRFPTCKRCGHGKWYHRLDDALNVSPVDPTAPFRCIWPTPGGPAVQFCRCPDYERRA